MVVSAFGGAEVLKPAPDMPRPTPGDNDLLVEVRAAGLNPIDWKIRKGALAQGRTLPIILGYDASGIVREVGRNVTGIKPGDEVYAMPALTRNGSNAEFVAVDHRAAATKPRTVDHVHAAAMPLVSLTAWEAMYDRCKIQSGETVLIHAGGGGVGHVAIQLAKLRGCRVLTTASRDESIKLCHDVGADVVINHAQEDFAKRALDETGGKGCATIFDCVGGATFDNSVKCLAVEGRLCTIVSISATANFRDLFVKCSNILCEFVGAPGLHGVHPETQGRALKQMAELVDQGKLKIHVSRVFELEQLAEAHRMQETGHVTGKLALRVS
jgi:NADPH2:quinone reductase